MHDVEIIKLKKNKFDKSAEKTAVKIRVAP